MKTLLVTVVVICGLAGAAVGHGYVSEPVARGSRWRFDSLAMANYDDMSLFCGGFAIQWYENDGKCGLCGDDYAKPQPRMHELGGLYGDGKIVQNYTQGQVISVTVELTANHRGYFVFQLCNLDAYGNVESDECFAQHQVLLDDGESKYYLPSQEAKPYQFNLKLPTDLVCQHCVLQWTYVTGNSWGYCDEDQTHGALGCGLQENFRTCSDIAILPGKQ